MIVDEGKTNQSFATNKVKGETMNTERTSTDFTVKTEKDFTNAKSSTNLTMNTDWKDELECLANIPADAPKGFIHIDYLIPKIESLLKEQRENCADIVAISDVKDVEFKFQKVYNAILNAPEPGKKQ